MTLFSVIVPIYKVEKYIHECIDSVLKQSFQNFELILVDDGSPDNCPQICDNYAKKVSNIKIIHKINGGLSSARNAGLSIACGRYIIFLDSDDYWIPSDFLYNLNSIILNTNPDIIHFNSKKIYSDHEGKPYFSKKKMSDEIWTACAWNKCIRRELFQDNDLMFVEGVTNEDADWCARLIIFSSYSIYLDEVVVAYRQRDGSITKEINKKSFEMELNNTEKISNIVKIYSKNITLMKFFSYQVAILILNLSRIEKKSRKKYLLKIKSFAPYLKYSKVKKVKYMNIVYKIFGIRVLVKTMKFVR